MLGHGKDGEQLQKDREDFLEEVRRGVHPFVDGVNAGIDSNHTQFRKNVNSFLGSDKYKLPTKSAVHAFREYLGVKNKSKFNLGQGDFLNTSGEGAAGPGAGKQEVENMYNAMDKIRLKDPALLRVKSE